MKPQSHTPTPLKKVCYKIPCRDSKCETHTFVHPSPPPDLVKKNMPIDSETFSLIRSDIENGIADAATISHLEDAREAYGILKKALIEIINCHQTRNRIYYDSVLIAEKAIARAEGR